MLQVRFELSEQQIILRFNIKESTQTEVTGTLIRVTDLPIKGADWAEDRYILELENLDMVHNVTPNLEMITSEIKANIKVIDMPFSFGKSHFYSVVTFKPFRKVVVSSKRNIFV